MNELDHTFAEVAQIIEEARSNAYRKVNEELILMYQKVGQFLSQKSREATYGDSYIESLAEYIRKKFPGIKGCNRRGLYRMKQFYEAYVGNEKVSALLTQLNWTNNLLILSGSKSAKEREFYICLAVKEHYSSRQLERQIDSGYYERCMLSKDKLLPETLHTKQNPFLDSYIVEFLDLPDTFHENDFRRGLVLCASKNDEVVEYAMSRTLSPMMVSRYQLQLPDKDVLRRKLKNLTLSMGRAGI